MRSRSLRGELLAWLLIPLTAGVLFNVWTTYADALSTANIITDHTLLASARVIAEQVRDNDGVVEALIPPSALELFTSDAHDRVVYRVTAPDGELIAGYPDVALPPQLPDGLQPFYFDARFRVDKVRAVAIAQPVISERPTGNALVVVAETLRGRDRLVTDLWIKALRDQVLLVAVAGLFAVFGLNRWLAPLLRLRDQVTERDPASLKSFAPETLQKELQPLVHAMNDAFGRVQTYVALQRRFIANASHQLRTPLTVLKMQATVGLRETDASAKDEALKGIDSAADAMSHLVNQLLTLARAEPGSGAIRKEIVDLTEVAREALERLAVLALDRGIDLGFEPDDAAALILGHATLLQELVVNLVDNALRHTPRGGAVTIALKRTDGDLLLQIEDSGPGIPEAERVRVFERFYRILGTGIEGTGLGLAIVKEIVASHDGSIKLAERTPPPGLVVKIKLPAAMPPAG
jgi:two-component system, OmpR family, sensor histidine kinase TctE